MYGHLTLALILLSAAAPADAENWPRFRGPNGAGCSPTPSPAAWSEENRLWSVPLPGVGHGSPIVWDGRIFLLAGDPDSGARIPLAVDADTGRLLWQRPTPASAHKHHRFNSLASSTPAADADRV